MSSSDLLAEPGAVVKGKEVVLHIFTNGPERKVKGLPRDPGYQALHPSPYTTDHKAAEKPKKSHVRKVRSPKKSREGSGRGTSRTTDGKADKAVGTKDASSKKADVAPADSGFQSNSESKPLETEKSPAVPSKHESAARETSASQVATSSERKKKTGKAQDCKRLAVISDDSASSSSNLDAFAQSCFPEAVVLKRIERNKNADTESDLDHGSPASISKLIRPAQPLACDSTPALSDAVELSHNRPEASSAAAEGPDGTGKHSLKGDPVVIPTSSSCRVSPSLRTSSPKPTAVRPSKLPAEAALLVPSDPLADTSESENSAPWNGRIMNIIKHDSVPTDAEKKRPPMPKPFKSRYSGTADYQVTLARLRVGLFANDREEPSRSSVLRHAWVLLPLVIVVAALTVVLLMRKHRAIQNVSVLYLQNESGVCTTEACRRVVAFTVQNTDAEFNPCVDFHRHACGRWFADRTARRSYAHENWLNFTAAAHQAMKKLPLTVPPGNQDSPHSLHKIQMAHFYASCLSYARNRPSIRASVVLGRMGLNESTWIGFSSLQQLFDHVVAASYETGLPGVVRVGKSALDKRPVVDVGESLYSTLGDHTTYFLGLTLRQLGLQYNLSLATAIRILDAGIEEARKRGKVNASSPSTVINIRENAASLAPNLSWAVALNHAFSSSNGTDNTADALITIRALEPLKGAITILSRADLKEAGLYSLLVMLAQVMKYPYLLATNYASFEDVPFCLQATGEHMEDHFTSWLARSLEDESVPTYLDDMVAALNQAIERSTWLNDNLAVNLADVSERLVVQRAGILSDDCVSDNSMALGQAPEVDYDDFLANILRARKAAASCLRVDTVANGTAVPLIPHLEALMRGPADALVIPTSMLTPDLLHANAEEPSLDYSTLGVMLLVEWAHAVSDRRPALKKRLLEYTQCIRKDAFSLLLVNNVTDTSLRTMVFVPWALDLALAAARSQWRANNRIRRLKGTTSAEDIPPVEDAATDRLRVQLFFRRFCQTTCGDKEAAKVCDYGVLRSGQFAKYFQCTWPETDADCR